VLHKVLQIKKRSATLSRPQYVIKKKQHTKNHSMAHYLVLEACILTTGKYMHTVPSMLASTSFAKVKKRANINKYKEKI